MHATTRITRIWLTTWGLTLASVGCFGAEPRTYALVAAMGDRFAAVHEVERIGSHLAPFRRSHIEAPDNALNKVVLASLDAAIAKMDPSSRRVYLAISLPSAVQDRAASLETAALERVIEELRAMPARKDWDRIVVMTPAMSGIERDGMASRLQGMGLFTEPLCQGEMAFCESRLPQPQSTGIAVETPSGEKTTASRYVAPFLHVKLWILDPASLAVLDTQEVFDHKKVYDPAFDALDMNRMIDRKVLAARILDLVDKSTQEALAHSELRGKVDVNERGEVRERRSP